MVQTGLNMETMKEKNRALILNYINASGPVSRKDISAGTGLTPSAVTQICSTFIQEGILKELGIEEEGSGVGRKKILVDIDWQSKVIVCVNIEVPLSTVCICDLSGNLIAQSTVETWRSIEEEKFFDSITAEILKLVKSNSKLKKKLGGVCVSVPGSIDKAKGTSLHAYGIWRKEIPVCSLLEERLKKAKLPLSVMIENNVNALGLAELIYGKDKHIDDFFIIKWGPGVGCTIVANRQIYEGRHGKAAELGHYIVEKNGLQCNCGKRGCLETKVSYSALNSVTPFKIDEFGEAYEKALKEKNSSLEAFDNAIDLFARAVVNTVTVLSPGMVVLCGKLFKSEKVRQKLIECCSFYDERCTSELIKYSTLADKEEYIGQAAAFVHEKIFH